MKKFFANFLVFLALLLSSIAAFPWNKLSSYGLNIAYINSNEVLIKSGIGGLLLILSLIFLLVANHEYRVNNEVNLKTARAAFLPLYMFAIAMMLFATSLAYYIYPFGGQILNKLIVGGLGLMTLNLIIFGHFLGTNFRNESNGRRIMHFILLIEYVAFGGGIAYWLLTYNMTNYAGYNTLYFAGLVPLALILYIVHIIVMKIKVKRNAETDDLMSELNQSRSVNSAITSAHKGVPQKGSKKKGKVAVSAKDDKKTIIVSREQTITSGGNDIDPTNIIYEDVSVDPEFAKMKGAQPNSIEYYIEKPKMFKPLNPTFDELVAYVRELPHVVTKLEDEQITFYVDRKPFLVLMNLGDYYRMAFKYDLEKGIRLIIKYPTISKNKGTRDELWFKANNYGDLPKEVVYQIVKTSYDNVNA